MPPREVLRRHGAAKTNVVDVARLLGMSHANIYRHFASKKALLDAIAARWLHQISQPLAVIAARDQQPASQRLTAWFDALRLGKRRKLLVDPELFRIYLQVTEQAHEVVGDHVALLLAQVQSIIADGIATEEFFPHPAPLARRPAPFSKVRCSSTIRRCSPSFPPPRTRRRVPSSACSWRVCGTVVRRSLNQDEVIGFPVEPVRHRVPRCPFSLRNLCRCGLHPTRRRRGPAEERRSL